jgi:hypothetical protein
MGFKYFFCKKWHLEPKDPDLKFVNAMLDPDPFGMK